MQVLAGKREAAGGRPDAIGPEQQPAFERRKAETKDQPKVDVARVSSSGRDPDRSEACRSDAQPAAPKQAASTTAVGAFLNTAKLIVRSKVCVQVKLQLSCQESSRAHR